MSNKKWKIIFVLGSPGGGKNTQCDLIEEKYQIFHFSCGDLLRAAVKENAPESELINKYIKAGEIVPGKITCGLQKKTMEKNGQNYDYYLCDGFPRNEENLKCFMEIFGDEIEISGVLYLRCSEEECIKRIMKRGGNRIDDNIDSIKKRFKVMENETVPNLENLRKFGPVHFIEADKGVKEVFEDICGKIDGFLPKRKTPLKK